MITMVRFTCSGEGYCIPVASTRGVRMSKDIRMLPGSGADIAGVLPGDPALTVLSVLGDGTQVLILELADLRFGLLVGAVTGLCHIDAADIHAVAGSRATFITGTVQTDGTLTFVADAHALAARL